MFKLHSVLRCQRKIVINNISLLAFSCFSCFLLEVCEVFVDPTVVAVVAIVETGISASRISSMNFEEICSDS